MVKFIQENTWLYILATILSIILMCALACVRSLARQVPQNYILLLGFTICQSYVVATIASFYEPMSVLFAAAGALVCFGVLTLYALCTPGDLNFCAPIVLVCAVSGIMMSILCLMF